MIRYLLIFSFVTSISCSNTDIHANNKKQIETYGPYEFIKNKWKEKDTSYFNLLIDSLAVKDFPDIISHSYLLSEITGFGWAFYDYNLPKSYYDTIPAYKLKNLKDEIIFGFDIYRKSDLYMVDLKKTVLVYKYFPYRMYDPVDSTMRIRVQNFLNDVAGSEFDRIK